MIFYLLSSITDGVIRQLHINKRRNSFCLAFPHTYITRFFTGWCWKYDVLMIVFLVDKQKLIAFLKLVAFASG